MVSLPAIKSLMLQASKLLKGASVADRIVICGVPCFILSREPAPELAAALKRRSRKSSISSMSTIEESEEHSESPSKIPKQFAGSTGRYRQRDVVFHLTGGGFFAHTIGQYNMQTNCFGFCFLTRILVSLSQPPIFPISWIGVHSPVR